MLMHAHLKERERKTERETRRPAENIHKYTQQTWETWNDTQGKEHKKKNRETRHKDLSPHSVCVSIVYTQREQGTQRTKTQREPKS